MKKLYQKIKNKVAKKEVKILIENFFSLSFLKIVTMLLPLVILPHLAKVLTIDLVGVLVLVTAIMGYAGTIIDYGFSYTGVRAIANTEKNISKNTEIFLEVTCAKLILILTCFLFFMTIYFLTPWFKEYLILFVFSFINVALLSLSPDWFFQGIEKMRIIAIGEVIGKLISFFLIILLVEQKQDYILVPVFYALGQLFSLLIYIFFISEHIEISKIREISLNRIVLRFKEGWSVFLNILFPNLYNSYSYLAVGYFAGTAQVAIYDIARRFLSVSEILITVLSRVFFPSISRNIINHKIYIRLILYVALMLCLMQVSAAFFAIDFLFPISYQASKTVLLWQSLSPIVYALMTGYGLNYLIPLGKDIELRDITIRSSIVGFFIVTMLTYQYGAVGAALGVSFTWALRAILCYKAYMLFKY